jgi:hypothetical protein
LYPSNKLLLTIDGGNCVMRVFIICNITVTRTEQERWA